MAIRLDKPAKKDLSIDDLKKTFADLQTKARAFMVGQKFLKPQERAQKLQELTGAFQRMATEIEKFKTLHFA